MTKKEFLEAIKDVPDDAHVVYRNDDYYQHDLVYKVNIIPDGVSTSSCLLPGTIIELWTAGEGSPAFIEQVGQLVQIKLPSEYSKNIDRYQQLNT